MLTNKQIKHLRALAHPLHFVIQTGDKGLTEAVQNEIAVALKAHELIKVKLNAEREERDAMITAIEDKQQCQVVQYIGKTVVLFKRNSNNIKITLPKH
ncbi:MAG: ribosome assembly RNA-binding protein YhbY [Gammaproteobacteria bacterium]|nr:MAG: ribosome assembly RNA-binding protein YhbY [Gammaproteobacteria bacterium]